MDKEELKKVAECVVNSYSDIETDDYDTMEDGKVLCYNAITRTDAILLFIKAYELGAGIKELTQEEILEDL